MPLCTTAAARQDDGQNLPATPAPPAPPPAGFALPARRAPEDPYRDLTTAERDLLFAKRDWARRVWELHRTERNGRRIYSEATAVAAASDPDAFPALARAGKMGANFMSPKNYRNVVRALTVQGHPRWDGVDLLIKRYRGGRPSRVADNCPFVQDVLALWLNPRQPYLTECWRAVAATYRRGGARTEDLPPPNSVAHYIRQHVSPTLIERYRGGAKQYADGVRGYVARRFTDVAVGDVLCADHRRVDYWTRVPDPDAAEGWVARRLTCSSIEDLRSRYRVATLLYADQSANHRIVAELLWSATLANGGCPPRIFYVDNGKDFLKAGLTLPVLLRRADGTPIIDPGTGKAYEHSVCRELGIAVADGQDDPVKIKRARGYNGQEKPIEGSFGADARLYDRMQVGYTGNSPVERARMGGTHYDGDISRLPSIEQARANYAAWLDDFHSRPTQSKICPAETRALAWQTMRRPTRAPLTREQLDYAFLIPQALCPLVGQTPAGTGGVRYSGWTYSHAELRRQGLWGKPIMVKLAWSDEQIAHERGGSHPPRVFLFHPDGRFIAQAAADGTVAPFVETEEERAELADQCHIIAAAAQMDSLDFAAQTGRTRMIADPAQALRIDAAPGGQRTPLAPPATPPRPRLAGASKPEVDRVPGADASDLRAAMEDVVFGHSADQVVGDFGDDTDRMMEAMGYE